MNYKLRNNYWQKKNKNVSHGILYVRTYVAMYHMVRRYKRVLIGGLANLVNFNLVEA